MSEQGGNGLFGWEFKVTGRGVAANTEQESMFVPAAYEFALALIPGEVVVSPKKVT